MLESLKENVCRVAKKAQADGLCKHKSGNFSQRDPATGLVVITPTGVDREILQPRDLVVIDGNAEVVENLSGLKPTSEALMHLTVYKTRPETCSVAHTHSLYATTFAIVNKPIPAVTYEAFEMGLTQGRIPVAPYARPGTEELARSVVAPCQESQCVLLERHGVLAFDSAGIDAAYLKVSYVEELAHLYYNALTIGGGAEPGGLSQEELSSWSYPDQVKL